jgi:hypothetical protein
MTCMHTARSPKEGQPVMHNERNAVAHLLTVAAPSLPVKNKTMVPSQPSLLHACIARSASTPRSPVHCRALLAPTASTRLCSPPCAPPASWAGITHPLAAPATCAHTASTLHGLEQQTVCTAHLASTRPTLATLTATHAPQASGHQGFRERTHAQCARRLIQHLPRHQ